MQYVGGKFRQRRDFVPAILGHTAERARYLEPFVGGGSMLERMAPHFARVKAADVVPDLPLLYAALRDGWEPPQALSREEYRALRHAEPSALRAFAGFGCSFGGKWFGGYTERLVGTAYRNLTRMAPALTNVDFYCRSYDAWKTPPPGTVVYADPPYAAAGVHFQTGAFDHGRFWDTMTGWVSDGVHVFVSEFTAPAGWVAIVNSVQKLTMSSNSGVTRRTQEDQHDRLWVPEQYAHGYSLDREA